MALEEGGKRWGQWLLVLGFCVITFAIGFTVRGAVDTDPWDPEGRDPANTRPILGKRLAFTARLSRISISEMQPDGVDDKPFVERPPPADPATGVSTGGNEFMAGTAGRAFPGDVRVMTMVLSGNVPVPFRCAAIFRQMATIFQ